MHRFALVSDFSRSRLSLRQISRISCSVHRRMADWRLRRCFTGTSDEKSSTRNASKGACAARSALADSAGCAMIASVCKAGRTSPAFAQVSLGLRTAFVRDAEPTPFCIPSLEALELTSLGLNPKHLGT